VSSPSYNSYYLFTLAFLSKQIRHEKNIVSFYFFLFISGRAKCLQREQCVGSPAALCSSCSLQKCLESSFECRWAISVNVKEETHNHGSRNPYISLLTAFFFLLALQPPLGVVFYSPLVGFSLRACEVF